MDREVFLFFLAPLVINLGLGIFILLTISRTRLTPVSRGLAATILGAALWSFGYSMELISPSLDAKLFWARFQYFGVTTVPLAWCSFAFRHAGSAGFPGMRRWQQALAVFLPVLIITLVWSNDLHHLIWSEVRVRPVGSFQVLDVAHGPMFWVYLGYSYLLMLAGSLKLMSGMLAALRVSRWRTALRLVAVMIPWTGNLVYITGLNPVPPLDWSPLAFSISGLLFAISLVRTPMIDLLPIAQSAVFDVVPDSLLVLDARDHLVEMNSAARAWLEDSGSGWRGQPVGRVIPEAGGWVARAPREEPYHGIVTWAGKRSFHYYELSLVPLLSADGRVMGRLAACHDITEHRLAQAQQAQVREHLEELVAARTVELTQAVEQLRELAVRLSEVQEYQQRQVALELHDRVGQNLTGLNLNLQVIRDSLPPDGAGPLQRRLVDSIRLVEETTRQVRSLMADLNPPLLEEYGLAAALRFASETFMARTGIVTTLIGEDQLPRLPERVEMALFRIVQEGLINVVKHALAGEVVIRVGVSDTCITLSVEDNGRGFDSQAVPGTGSQPRWGLLGIRERAASIGGDLQILSAPGAGTSLQIQIPREA